MVKQILDELPEELQEAVENVVIHIDDTPSPELLADSPHLSPGILGLYIGVPLSRQSVFSGFIFPAQIYLFRENIARYAGNRSALRYELRETLLHEIGHHLGLDEDDLRALEGR
jgi:predicted Zn-dependent protease with MMP-like domain